MPKASLELYKVALLGYRVEPIKAEKGFVIGGNSKIMKCLSCHIDNMKI